MADTLGKPSHSDSLLRAFSTLNHPLGEGTLEHVQNTLNAGNLSLHDLWLLSDENGRAHAALRLQPYPGRPQWQLGTLRTAPTITDDAATALFTHLRTLSSHGKPLHIVYNDKTARDFGTLPAHCGWQGGDTYSISYRTDLNGREDLVPDPAAWALELDMLLSDNFKSFYDPIWRGKNSSSDEQTLEEALYNLYAFAKKDEGQLYALHHADLPVAMGLVTSFTVLGEHAASCNMLGVVPEKRRQGWGKRLHRHLMWAARARSALYLGSTDSTNVAMRQLLEVNGCTPERRDWELEPTDR